jgi:hypothetical protein
VVRTEEEYQIGFSYPPLWRRVRKIAQESVLFIWLKFWWRIMLVVYFGSEITSEVVLAMKAMARVLALWVELRHKRTHDFATKLNV